MGVFTQADQALEWRGGQEIVRIEPWGPGSLRVRGTVWETIRDDLPGPQGSMRTISCPPRHLRAWSACVKTPMYHSSP